MIFIANKLTKAEAEKHIERCCKECNVKRESANILFLPSLGILRIYIAAKKGQPKKKK